MPKRFVAVWRPVSGCSFSLQLEGRVYENFAQLKPSEEAEEGGILWGSTGSSCVFKGVEQLGLSNKD